MIHYSNQIFHSLADRGESFHFQKMRFEGCTFFSCLLSLTEDPQKRSRVANVHIKDCCFDNCECGPAILESVHIDGLRSPNLLICWGTLFNQVVIEGNICSIKVQPMISPLLMKSTVQAEFDSIRDSYYRSVDFAIDISKAKFSGIDISGIPVRKIRRDPETQFVYDSQSSKTRGWQQLVRPDNYWTGIIESMLVDCPDEGIIVVPVRAKKDRRERLLRDARELQAVGFLS